MSSKRSLRGGAAGLMLLAGLVLVSPARGQNCDCQRDCCPPCFKYIYEGPPKIKFKHGCPKPICDPCHLPHYGYYPTCWQPWPWPPDWSHCAVPPPAALVQPVPPKRFREEPATEEKGKDGAQSSTPAPMPSREPRSATTTPQFLPPVTPTSIDVPPLPEGKAPMPETHTPMPETKTPTREPIPSPLAPMRLESGVTAPGSEEPPPLPPELPLKNEDGPPLMPTGHKELLAAPKKIEPHKPRAAASTVPGRRSVNCRRILLDYDLKDVPAPEHSMLELWYTQDGRSWHKDQTQVKSGAPYVVEVNREGSYGFMMVARAAGEKSEPPAAGESPQVWVDVDWTPPAVSLLDVKPGMGSAGRIVSIAWTASDSNLAEKPITLSYAERPDGPWTPFATAVENVGRHIWLVPNNVPRQVYLRVEAFDKVGNSGTAQTPAAVRLP